MFGMSAAIDGGDGPVGAIHDQPPPWTKHTVRLAEETGDFFLPEMLYVLARYEYVGDAGDDVGAAVAVQPEERRVHGGSTSRECV
jgi:hypothetical protein